MYRRHWFSLWRYFRLGAPHARMPIQEILLLTRDPELSFNTQKEAADFIAELHRKATTYWQSR